MPVDLLVKALWLNANRPREHIAHYMSLRLKKMLTNVDVNVPTRVGPQVILERGLLTRASNQHKPAPGIRIFTHSFRLQNP